MGARKGPGSVISTHALREEGDPMRQSGLGGTRDFYPRPPRGGRPSRAPCGARLNKGFLPTPSARRATTPVQQKNLFVAISTHALREEGDLISSNAIAAISISTHALREEGDRSASTVLSLPLISTHALREEGDPEDCSHGLSFGNFYPRPPRGGRRAPAIQGGQPLDISTHALREEGDSASFVSSLNPSIFLPTPSARRATANVQ